MARVGIGDVARRAGVSTATVSRALRGLPNVAPETRQRVQEAAADLGYRADPDAARLASGRSAAIGMAAPFLDTWFVGKVAQGARRVVQDSGRDFHLFTAEPGGADLAESDLVRRAAGVLVVDVPVSADHQQVAEPVVPYVAVGAASGLRPAVTIDDRGAAAAAVDHLLQCGHRRIALIGDPASEVAGFQVAAQRRQGYLDALEHAGIDVDDRLLVSGGFTADGGAGATEELLDLDDPPTAVFAISDTMAIGALGTARRAGLRVPDDLAVMGFDDHEHAVHLGLSTVRQDPAAQGAAAAAWLVGVLDGHAPDPPPPATWELVPRASTG